MVNVVESKAVRKKPTGRYRAVKRRGKELEEARSSGGREAHTRFTPSKNTIGWEEHDSARKRYLDDVLVNVLFNNKEKADR